jgi:hypothetical protein
LAGAPQCPPRIVSSVNVCRKVPETRSHQPDQAAGSARPVRGQGVPAGAARQPIPRLLRRVQRTPAVRITGDDPKDIDWLVYAKTDKYYVKKFEAETNITGYLAMDLSQSMGYTYRQELTKFDYAICLAAALCYLMVSSAGPGRIDHVRSSGSATALAAHVPSGTQLANVLSHLSRLKPTGQTDVATQHRRRSRPCCAIAAW